MATNTRLVAQVSQELLDELTDGGTRDLREVRLSQMEEEVYASADRVSQRLLRGVLEDQAGQADMEHCACCHAPLEDRPANEDPIRMRRVEVKWDKPVKRRPKCRRDFFPSGGDAEMPGGSDLQS